MLFSNPTLAAQMNKNFECAWQELRPVPQVHIDFGDGNELRRTLVGNIATWIAAADGRAIDVIPALYSEQGYLARLNEARALFDQYESREADTRDAFLRAHYAAKVKAPVLAVLPAQAMLKATIEDRIKDQLMEREEQHNRKHRAKVAHAYLARSDETSVDELTAPIFKHVLDVDLADPYLGLAPYVLGGERGRMRHGKPVAAPKHAFLPISPISPIYSPGAITRIKE